MIILGSEKYPEYKEFQKLVDNHDGKVSFTTSSDHSTYYFHINTTNDSILEHVLDRFIQVFYELFYEQRFLDRGRDTNNGFNIIIETQLLHNSTWFKYFERSMAKSTHLYSKMACVKKKYWRK